MSPIFPLLIGLAIAADEPLAVRPMRGQELVYRGQFTEESRGLTVDRHSYEMESRTFVLETEPETSEVAFLTVLRATGAATGSARLELAMVNTRGRIKLQLTGLTPRVPLDGPPSLEPAGFVELPSQAVGKWDVADGSRPPRGWRIDGEEFRGGVRCLKLVGEQEATGWRRTDTVWVTSTTGLVRRLERTIERWPDGVSAGYTSRTEYELAESSTFPDQLGADRRREIDQAGEYAHKLAALLPQAGRVAPPAAFAALIEKIKHFTADQPATPYRPGVIALRRRAEAAMLGEAPPAEAPDPATVPPAVGRTAPDFVMTDLIGGTTARLARWRGRPVVLLFVRPDSTAAGPTLRLAADLQSRYADRLHVAVLVVSDESRARPAWAAAGVPLFAGKDAANLYAATGPSRVVVVDAQGTVRHLGDCGPGVIDAVHRVVSGN
jgi:hypothetical protein